MPTSRLSAVTRRMDGCLARPSSHAANEVIWIGADRDLPATLTEESANEHHVGGACVTPGLIDCHTHLVYAGNRAREFELRLQGATYEEIARAGGGIRSTVAATREASMTSCCAGGRARAKALMREGVTAVEIKSGLRAERGDEARCLRMARRVGEALPLTVRTTFLAPMPFRRNSISAPTTMSRRFATGCRACMQKDLIDAVDAFCERIGFTVAQTRQVFERARSLGLPVKLHAEQLSDQHGAALAAEFAALSCDHLEYVGSDGIAAMASAGTVAVLLPGAYYSCARHSCRRLRRCARRACPLRWRPTTIRAPPTPSPLLMMNMACTLFRMTPEEVWRGFTVNAARALGYRPRTACWRGARRLCRGDAGTSA